MSARARLALALGLVALAAVAVVAALVTIGGPGAARLERLDEVRIREAVELVNAVERHRILTGRLPETLEEVRAGPSGPPSIRDPETGAPYEYAVLGERRFRVCIRLSAPEAALAWPGPIRMPESPRLATMALEPGGERACWESADPPG